MFYEYASRCADELEDLQNQLIEAGEDPDELDTDDDNGDNGDRNNNDNIADGDVHLSDNSGGGGGGDVGGGSQKDNPLSVGHNRLLP